jgi:type IV pilus assembly protein PilV
MPEPGIGHLGEKTMHVQFETQRKQKESGFTILEVLVAISILSFGLLGVASMQTASIRGNNTAYRQTEAMSIAQDRLERLMALPYDDSALDDGTHGDPYPGGPNIYKVTYKVDDGSVAGGQFGWTMANSKLIVMTVVRAEQGVGYKPYRLRILKLQIS